VHRRLVTLWKTLPLSHTEVPSSNSAGDVLRPRANESLAVIKHLNVVKVWSNQVIPSCGRSTFLFFLNRAEPTISDHTLVSPRVVYYLLAVCFGEPSNKYEARALMMREDSRPDVQYRLSVYFDAALFVAALGGLIIFYVKPQHDDDEWTPSYYLVGMVVSFWLVHFRVGPRS
jgi:hypothetical protein